jgi:hypothetical protein
MIRLADFIGNDGGGLMWVEVMPLIFLDGDKKK